MKVGDKAQRAFRKYARLCPNAEKISYFDLCRRLRGCCRSDKEALEMLAVFETLRWLRASDKTDAADAVTAVYLSNHGRAPRKNDISCRVRKFAVERLMDERTVWRRLDEAKRLYLKFCEASIK